MSQTAGVLPAPTPTLTAADRCDRCGAQALAVVRRGPAELLLCGHHADEHGPALVADGWEIRR